MMPRASAVGRAAVAWLAAAVVSRPERPKFLRSASNPPPGSQAASARRLSPARPARCRRRWRVGRKGVMLVSSRRWALLVGPLVSFGRAPGGSVLRQTLDQRHEAHRSQFVVIVPVRAARHLDQALH